MKTLVVGAGEMGQWFADATGWETAFADIDPAAAERAAQATDNTTAPIDGHDSVAPDDTDNTTAPTGGEESYDIVCIAVPMPAVPDAIEQHAHRADRAIVDVAGVMAPALTAMETHAPDLERASLHPLFSSSNAPGAVPIAVDHGGPAIDALRERLTDSGNDLVDCTATEHDEAMETIQAAAHTAVLAYGLTVGDVPAGFSTPVSEQLDSLVSQITGGDPRVYADIQETFDGAQAVALAAEQVATADREGFYDLFDAAGSGAMEPEEHTESDRGDSPGNTDD